MSEVREVADGELSTFSAGRISAHLRQIAAEGPCTWQDVCEWFELQYPRLADRITPRQLAQCCPVTMFGTPWDIERDLAVMRQRREEAGRREVQRMRWLVERPKGAA